MTIRNPCGPCSRQSTRPLPIPFGGRQSTPPGRSASRQNGCRKHTGEELTRDDFIKAELALQDAKLEAGIDLEKEKSPGLIGKYHDWKKNRVRHKVNKKKYLLLCLFLGWCGGHRYYEKRYALAAFYTLFFWSMVPFFLCVTDLLIALPMHADENGDILI